MSKIPSVHSFCKFRQLYENYMAVSHIVFEKLQKYGQQNVISWLNKLLMHTLEQYFKTT